MNQKTDINSLISVFEVVGHKITKKTRDKIEKVVGLVEGRGKYGKYKKKYENLSYWLEKNNKYIILIQFLLVSDKLKIDRKFTTESGEYFFNLSIDFFNKYYKIGRATFNRAVNLFVLLGLIGKVNPYKQNVKYSIKQEDLQTTKVVNTKNRLRKEQGRDNINDKIIYKYENLYFNVDYTAKLLMTAEETAKELTRINFKPSATSSIYFYRIGGEEVAAKVFYGADYKTETRYSNFLTESIENAVLKQIHEKGYTRKSNIYFEVKSKLVAHYQNEPKKRKGRDRNTAKAVFEREYKRTIDFIIIKYNLEYMRRPTKEIKEIFGLKKDSAIIFDKKILEEKRKANGKRKNPKN